MKNDNLLRTGRADLISHQDMEHSSWKITDRTKPQSQAILLAQTQWRTCREGQSKVFQGFGILIFRQNRTFLKVKLRCTTLWLKHTMIYWGRWRDSIVDKHLPCTLLTQYLMYFLRTLQEWSLSTEWGNKPWAPLCVPPQWNKERFIDS